MSATLYVSATFLDLKAHRAAVRDAIRQLGHVDLSMEYYIAEPKRPVTRCLDDVRRCDLYLGLFARRYGLVPPASQLSITEQEYRAALRFGKDIVCFLLRDDAPWPPQYVDEGDLAAKLKALRNEISVDYLAGFFTTPDELAAKLSAAVVRALQLGATPVDADREHRLMKEWRTGATRADRVRARLALFNMGSPRDAAAVKDQLLAAKDDDVEEIAIQMGELLALGATSRQAMPVLVDLVAAGSAETRRFALFHIGELGLRGKELHVDVVRALTTLRQDPSATVRAELAHSLGQITHREEALPAVRACLDGLSTDGDAAVRGRAEESRRLIG